MAILRFELPDILYKVTKSYNLRNYHELHKYQQELTSVYYFKDINLAEEFYNKIHGQEEFVEVKLPDYNIANYLFVLASFEIINTIDIIPNVVDL